jgi:endoglucanase
MRWLRSAMLLLMVSLAGMPAARAENGPIALKRGVSIHEWRNWSPLTDGGDYRWPPYRNLRNGASERDFARIKELGFDFVRLSVDPGPLLATADARREEAAVALLEQVVRVALHSGLKVVLDLHPVSQSDGITSARYGDVVSSVAAMLAHVGTDFVALELMDEPQVYPCDDAGGAAWEEMLEGLIDSARIVAPDLSLIVSGSCGGNVKGLVQLDPARFADDRLLYSFHFYEPLEFTHQGVAKTRDVKGAPWPADEVAIPLALIYSRLLVSQDADETANDQAARLTEVRRYLDAYVAGHWDEARLKARFGEVRAWAERHKLPTDRLFLGEFGVMRATDWRGGALDGDRLRWLGAVRHEAEELGAPWAYWEYSNPNGMSLTTYDKSRQADPIALKALGLATDTAELPTGTLQSKLPE